jgi:predicted transposase YdaD
MSNFKCTKELYKAFLQASSVRYSGLALSEVSPTELSHDSISRWLKNKCFRPREIWEISEAYLDKNMSVAQKIEQQGLQRGLQQGRHEGELSLAKKLLNQGIDLDLIKNAGGFSEQELIELEKA